MAELLGVARETVRDWFASTNGGTAKATSPDARVKLNTRAKEVVVERVKKGETLHKKRPLGDLSKPRDL